MALQHEEALLDLVSVRGVALADRHIHDRQREVAGRDDVRVGVLAGAAGADEAVLRALEALDLGVLERGPVALLLAEAADVFLHYFLDRNAFQFLRTRVAGDAHGILLSNGKCCGDSRPAPRGASTHAAECTLFRGLALTRLHQVPD